MDTTSPLRLCTADTAMWLDKLKTLSKFEDVATFVEATFELLKTGKPHPLMKHQGSGKSGLTHYIELDADVKAKIRQTFLHDVDYDKDRQRTSLLKSTIDVYTGVLHAVNGLLEHLFLPQKKKHTSPVLVVVNTEALSHATVTLLDLLVSTPRATTRYTSTCLINSLFYDHSLRFTRN
jgi:hypothetical protein